MFYKLSMLFWPPSYDERFKLLLCSRDIDRLISLESSWRESPLSKLSLSSAFSSWYSSCATYYLCGEPLNEENISDNRYSYRLTFLSCCTLNGSFSLNLAIMYRSLRMSSMSISLKGGMGYREKSFSFALLG
jgi:hypothetical protein